MPLPPWPLTLPLAALALLTLAGPPPAAACMDGGKEVSCCADAERAGHSNCSRCLATTDGRAAWGSPCLWLSAKALSGHLRCVPQKWWNVDGGASKAAGIHPCANCSGECAKCPPAPSPHAPPPCAAGTSPRAACWPGTWSETPINTPHAKSLTIDAPIVGNGVTSAALTLGKCSGAGPNALCYFLDRTDAWTPSTGAISDCDYSAAGSGTIGQLALSTHPAPASSSVFNATQDAATATVTITVPLAGGGFLHTKTVMARAENVLIVHVWTTGTAETVSLNATIGKLSSSSCYWVDEIQSGDSIVASRQVGSPYQDQLRSTVGLRRHIKYAVSAASPSGTVGKDSFGNDAICMSVVPGDQKTQVIVGVVHS